MQSGSYKDLTGLKCGQLTVLEHVTSTVINERLHTYWLCHCQQCDGFDVLASKYLTHKKNRLEVCSVCTRGPCLFCGGPVTTGFIRLGQGNTCSPFCKQQLKALRHAQFKGQQLLADPDYSKKQALAIQQKRHCDPDYNAKFLRGKREANRRADANRTEQQREQLRERNRKFHQVNAEQIADRKRETRRRQALADFMQLQQKLQEIDHGNH